MTENRPRLNDYWISYKTPAIQDLQLPGTDQAKLKLLIRREDQNHPFLSGNKWWKLKYNLREALQQNHHTILTFGGAYSNHIYAVAATCQLLRLKSIGIIRGEEIQPLNSTLSFARKCGMHLEFISRSDYRLKKEVPFLQSLQEKFGNCFIVPEGGTNDLAVRGCEELGKLLLDIDFDYLCLPVGTGGTIAGIIKAFDGERKIIGIPVLKNAGFLKEEIQNYLPRDSGNWQLMLDYHFGGYAKTSQALEKFMGQIRQSGIPTEHVYSGKLFWAVADMARKGFFEENKTVMVLHTGGLRNFEQIPSSHG